MESGTGATAIATVAEGDTIPIATATIPMQNSKKQQATRTVECIRVRLLSCVGSGSCGRSTDRSWSHSNGRSKKTVLHSQIHSNRFKRQSLSIVVRSDSPVQIRKSFCGPSHAVSSLDTIL